MSESESGRQRKPGGEALWVLRAEQRAWVPRAWEKQAYPCWQRLDSPQLSCCCLQCALLAPSVAHTAVTGNCFGVASMGKP